MKVFDGIEALPEPFARPFTRATVAIGVFDGVHRGHQAILRAAADDAKRNNRPALAFTFDRHPAELLAPERAPAYLTTPQQRNKLIEETGIDALIVARFNRELSELSPDDFLTDILKGETRRGSDCGGRRFWVRQSAGRNGGVAARRSVTV